MNAIVLTDRLEAAPIAPAKPILSIEDLNVRFGSVVAIESVSLTVRRGEFVSLLGTERLRQVDVAQGHRPPGQADRRADRPPLRRFAHRLHVPEAAAAAVADHAR